MIVVVGCTCFDMPSPRRAASRFSITERSFVASRMDTLKSPANVRRLFREEFNKSPPSKITVYRIHEKFKRTGSVANDCLGRCGRKRTVRNEQKIIQVRNVVEGEPGASTKRIALRTGVSKTTAWKICSRDLGLKPYRIQVTHALRPQDKLARLEHCHTLIALTAIDPLFCDRVIFSDEAIFHTSGHVNRRNTIFWGSEHPHVIREHIRDSPKVTVWCAVTASGIIGPYFFENSIVNQVTYRTMLEDFFLDNLPLPYRLHGYFQQDGAPSHTAHSVRAVLNAYFLNRWISRFGPIPWPAYSPDLTPLDFWLWGLLKDRVYQTPVPNLDVLRRRIRRVIRTITPAMCRRAIESCVERWESCIELGGGDIEPFLK